MTQSHIYSYNPIVIIIQFKGQLVTTLLISCSCLNSTCIVSTHKHDHIIIIIIVLSLCYTNFAYFCACNDVECFCTFVQSRFQLQGNDSILITAC